MLNPAPDFLPEPLDLDALSEDPRWRRFSEEFREQFEQLPQIPSGLSWDSVLESLTRPGALDALLKGVSALENPQLFKIDERMRLVFCDGALQTPFSTHGAHYFDNRSVARMAGLELFDISDYLELHRNFSTYFDCLGMTWIESGANPKLAYYAYIDKWGEVSFHPIHPWRSNPFLGARCVFRFPLQGPLVLADKDACEAEAAPQADSASMAAHDLSVDLDEGPALRLIRGLCTFYHTAAGSVMRRNGQGS